MNNEYEDNDHTTVTTQLTSKKLKLSKLISWVCVLLGLFIMLNGSADKDNTTIAWGCFIALYGFSRLTITRIKIWWYHK